MSGIFGITCPEGEMAGRACLDALETACRIYGADGSGVYQTKDAALGCYVEHFSACFPAGEPVLHQGRKMAVMDALLYNREELLPLTGLTETAGDEDVLFQFILRHGPEALARVNGDFAGAVYDEETKEWLLFRDPMGVRPLYLYAKDGRFAFATDIRGILAMPGADASLNEQQLYLRILGGNDISAHETVFACIRMLPAGHYARVSPESRGWAVKETAYFVPGSRKMRRWKRKDCERELYRLVEDAVRRRLQAVPGLVGAELSGGLDSAVIDVLMHRMGREVKYFSWSPPVEKHPLQDGDERLLIRSLCCREGIECEYAANDAESMMKLFARRDPPHVHTIRLGETAAFMKNQGVRAVFSGHGGDEGASHRMSELELWHQGEYLAFAREIYAKKKGMKMRLARTGLDVLRRIKKGKDYVQPFLYKKESNAALLQPAFRERMKNTPLLPLTFGYDPADYVKNGGLRLRLENAAFQAAEHGVRYLFPLLDARVMQFSLGIPRRMHLKNGVDRHLFRNAFAALLPEDVCLQKRKDAPGLASWHGDNELKDYQHSVDALLDRLDRKKWGKYWNMDAVDRIRSIAGTPDCPLDSTSINALFICWIIQEWQEGKKNG